MGCLRLLLRLLVWVPAMAPGLVWGQPAPAPPELEFAGCSRVKTPVDHPTCMLNGSSQQLRIWVRSAPDVPIVLALADRQWHSREAQPVQHGFLFRLEIPADFSIGALTATAGRPPWVSRRSLNLEVGHYPSHKGSDLDQLRSQLTAGVETERQGDLLLALARRVISAEGVKPAVSYLHQAVEAFARSGQRSREIQTLSMLHHYYNYALDQPARAHQTLVSYPEVARGDAFANFFVLNDRGIWARRNGRFRAALRDMEAAVRQSERLDLGFRKFGELERVHLLSRLGRFQESEASLQWLATQVGEESTADRYRMLTNMGWSRVLMSEAGHEADPIPYLDQALAAARESGKPESILNAKVNLGLAYLQQDRPQEARLHLDQAGGQTEAHSESAPWWIKTWLLDAEGRLALAEGRAQEALNHYLELAQLPATKFYPDAFWRAKIGQGQALEALARYEAALEAYGEAEAELWPMSLSAPLDGGRKASMNFFRRGTLRHLDLLLRLDRRGQAAELARRSRARVFHGLVVESRLGSLTGSEKDRWFRLISRYRDLQSEIEENFRAGEMAAADRADQLEEIGLRLERRQGQILNDALLLLDAHREAPDLASAVAGELWLVFHPLPSGWLGLAMTKNGVEVARLPSPDAALRADPAEFARRFLQPFAASIRDASRLKILPYGPLWRVHFEALPFDDGVLLQQAPVTYALDIPAPRGVTASRDALLIADPTGRLAHAGREVAQVAGALGRAEDHPWQIRTLSSSTSSSASPSIHSIESLDGRAESTVAGVLRSLAATGGLFHFAGHGDLFGSSGQSGLVLKQGFDNRVLLSIRDVLTLNQAPATVVLSGCDTLSLPAENSGSELGIGHAFLLAGSAAAVGAVEKVNDESAAELIRLFYQAWLGPGDEAAALRRAQLEMYRRSMPDWSSFRVLER